MTIPSNQVQAQELVNRLSVEHFSVKNGLSQNTIKAIVQDNVGFLWIGTDDGLNRYDGYQFKIYKPQRQQNGGLISGSISTLYIDSKQSLWVGTKLGIHRYLPKQDRFKAITEIDGQSIPAISIYDIVEHQGKVYFASNRGLIAWSLSDAHFEYLIADKKVSNLASMPGSHLLWLTTGDGLLTFDPRKKVFKSFALDDKSISNVLLYKSSKLLFQSDEWLWLASYGNGLYRINIAQASIERFSTQATSKMRLSGDYIQDLFFDGQQKLWVGTDHGLNVINLDSLSIDYYFSDVRDLYGLNSNDITTLYKDRSGLLWLGSYEQGLNRWNPANVNFTHYLNRADISNLNGSNYARSLMVDDQDRIWIGTISEGIFVVDRKAKTMQHIQHDPNNKHSITNNRISDITQTHDGSVWLVFDTDTSTDSVCRMSTMDVADKCYTIKDTDTYTLFEDHFGKIWLGTNKGAYQYNEVQDEFVVHPSIPTSVRIKVMHQDLAGYYWFGGRSGLFRFDENSVKALHFYHTENSNSLDNTTIHHLTEDDRGVIWVATESGLNKITWLGRENFEIERVFQEIGLADTWVNSVLATKSGDIWMGTSNGLKKYNPSKREIMEFVHKDGPKILDYYVRNAASARTNELFFGGDNGVNSFDPNKLYYDNYAAPLVLLSFQKGGQELHTIDTAKKQFYLELAEEANFVSFEFALLDFTNPDKNTYQYRVNTSDANWIDLGTQNRVNLSNLQKGTYKIEVIAAGPRGVPSKNKLELIIRVKNPFLRSGLANLIYVLAIVILVLALFHLQRRRYKVRFSDLETNLLVERQEHREVYQAKQHLETQIESLEYEMMQRDNTIRLIKKKYNDLHVLDPITGVKSKNFVSVNIERDLQQISDLYDLDSTENVPSKVALILVDIDGFHYINEHYGVLSGDNVLAQIAAVLRNACRGSDTLARWSGQQFLIIAHVSAMPEVLELVERVRNIIAARPFDLGNGGKTDLTCSIGFCMHPLFTDQVNLFTWEQLVDIAEQALFACKRTSRNTWIGLDGNTIRDAHLVRRKIAYDLHRFIQSGEISVYSSLADTELIMWTMGDLSESL